MEYVIINIEERPELINIETNPILDNIVIDIHETIDDVSINSQSITEEVVVDIKQQVELVDVFISEVGQKGDKGDKGASYVYATIFGYWNKIVTNAYIQINGMFSNVMPAFIPFDGKIRKIVAVSKQNSTWVAQIFKNDILIKSMQLSNETVIFEDVDIDVLFGDRIALYVCGSEIEMPRIELLILNT